MTPNYTVPRVTPTSNPWRRIIQQTDCLLLLPFMVREPHRARVVNLVKERTKQPLVRHGEWTRTKVSRSVSTDQYSRTSQEKAKSRPTNNHLRNARNAWRYLICYALAATEGTTYVSNAELRSKYRRIFLSIADYRRHLQTIVGNCRLM